MKITRRQLNRIIMSEIFGSENESVINENKLTDKAKKVADKIKNLPISKKIRGLFKQDKSAFPKNIEDEKFIAVYFDRFDDYTKEIATKNYNEMRKAGTLTKTGLEPGKSMKGEALLMSYLLQGHRDFQGLSREEIETLLFAQYGLTADHTQKSEINTFNQEFKSKIGKVITKKHKSIDSIISSGVNNITGETILSDMKTLDFVVNDQKILLNFHVSKFKDIAIYDYGFIPKKGEGKSLLAASVTITIGDQKYEIVHNKGFGASAIGDKKRAKLNRADGLHIDGTRVYGYKLDGSPSFSNPGMYEQTVNKIKRSISSFPKEEVSTVLAVFDEALKKIAFDPSVFKGKTKGRQEVLIGADGKSIVGSKNIDAHLKKKGITMPDFGLKPRNLKENKTRQVASNAELYRKRYARRYR